MAHLQNSKYLLFVIFLASHLGNASRLKPHLKLMASNSTYEGDSVHLGIQAGRVLGNRFRLESLLETTHPRLLGVPQWHVHQPMVVGAPRMRPVIRRPTVRFTGPQPGPPLQFAQPITRVVVQQPIAPKVPPEKPGEDFPAGTNFSDNVIEHLGAGQFGDVWRATDTATGEEVAVKVFYQHTVDGGKQYLTWNTADEANREEMRKNIKECELVKQIISQGQSIYQVGSSRICECRHEYIKQGMENKDNVMFTVWEMCGTSMTKLRTQLGSFLPSDRQRAARLLTKQVLEAINLFSMFNPQLIHHDLKADNAVVLGSLEAGYKVKLIDFGCFVRATPGNKYSQSIGDPDYMPPEHSVNSKAFEDPPSSFDIYGIGLIHLELLCPALEATDWSPARRMTQQMLMLGRKPMLLFSNVEAALRKRCPELFKLPGISSDLRLIEWLTMHDAASRPTPSQALEHGTMKGTFDKAIVLEFKHGDRVEYYSTTHGYWMPCVVKIYSDTLPGTYDLYYEEVDHTFKLLKKSADPARVRAEAKVDSSLALDESFSIPVIAMAFKVGDEVEYRSKTADRWYTCFVTKVTYFEDGSGTYDLSLEDGTPFRGNVPPERVRDPPFPVGTKVIIYNSLEGTVKSYDAIAETYNVLKDGTTDTYYRNIARDYVQRK